ncbi:MAG: ATP-binding protein [Limisphaerales bacterium]
MTGFAQATNSRRLPADPALRARDQRLEALKAVAGKLAHDFNNFLVPQFGYVTLLKEELPSNSGSAQYLDAMDTATRRTESYIDSILVGMRPERQFSPEEFAFDSLLNAALDQWSADAAPGRVVEVMRAIEPAMVFGDEKLWRSAVTQLLANARFALATGGKLEVELRRQTISGDEIARLGLGTDNLYCLTIRDNGFGMAPNVAERAFEPFFTTRTQIKAAGLGLTIVHSVTQIHGGQVELHSKEEQGTTVTVWIPASAVMAQRFAYDRGPQKRDSANRKKVLLIEDDPLMKEVLRDWLGRMDLEVHVAGDADEADRIFERKRGEFALVISESDFKGSTGEEVYGRLGEMNRGVPWIFLAGRRRPTIPVGAEDGSAGPLVMQKPVTLRALAEVVRRHAGR